MPIESQAVRGAVRLNAKFSVKDLGDWDKGIKEVCDHLGLSTPKTATARAVLEMSLERMLLDLREDLGDEKEALSILFGSNKFISEMSKKFPTGGELSLMASSFPDGSAMCWLRSDKAKLGRMAALSIEARSEGLGRRLMAKLSVVNISRQGGLELEEGAHLGRATASWNDLVAMEQLPAACVSGMDKGHAIAKWLKGTSERYSMARRANDEDDGEWKHGVLCPSGQSPKIFADMGASFEVWSDFKPENLLARLQELTSDNKPEVRRAPRLNPVASVRKS